MWDMAWHSGTGQSPWYLECQIGWRVRNQMYQSPLVPNRGRGRGGGGIGLATRDWGPSILNIPFTEGPCDLEIM